MLKKSLIVSTKLRRMQSKFQYATIEVPAGVQMTRLIDGHVRTYQKALQFKKAYRLIDDKGMPLDHLWRFYWLGKIYTVLQTEVSRVT